MHEHDFQILEGRDLTLPELGKEKNNWTYSNSFNWRH